MQLFISQPLRGGGVKIDLKKFNQISNKTPVLVNLKPTGSFYMEDFYHAGGMNVV